ARIPKAVGIRPRLAIRRSVGIRSPIWARYRERLARFPRLRQIRSPARVRLAKRTRVRSAGFPGRAGLPIRGRVRIRAWLGLRRPLVLPRVAGTRLAQVALPRLARVARVIGPYRQATARRPQRARLPQRAERP